MTEEVSGTPDVSSMQDALCAMYEAALQGDDLRVVQLWTGLSRAFEIDNPLRLLSEILGSAIAWDKAAVLKAVAGGLGVDIFYKALTTKDRNGDFPLDRAGTLPSFSVIKMMVDLLGVDRDLAASRLTGVFLKKNDQGQTFLDGLADGSLRKVLAYLETVSPEAYRTAITFLSPQPSAAGQAPVGEGPVVGNPPKPPGM